MGQKNASIPIIGPEASGKTMLAQKLAKEFGGIATEEYARHYFMEKQLPADHTLSADEMCEVMEGQWQAEQGEGVRFIDACVIHGPLYAAMGRNAENGLSFDYTAVDPRVLDYGRKGAYDAIILCRPHVLLEWEDDGQRAMPCLIDRHAFAESCYAYIAEHYSHVPVIMVDQGSWMERELHAIGALKEKFSL